MRAVAIDFDKPNGIAFSPDKKYLCIADTGIPYRKGGPRHIRRLDVSSDGKSLGASTVFADCAVDLFDGFRIDTDCHAWTSAVDGVYCYDLDGTLIGRVKIPELVSNLCFGGTG